MLRVDLVTAILSACCISALAYFWIHKIYLFSFRALIYRKNFLYSFFYCWACVLLKISFLFSFYLSPTYACSLNKYLVFFIDWMVLFFLSLVLYSILLMFTDKASKIEDEESEKIQNELLVILDKKKRNKKGLHF